MNVGCVLNVHFYILLSCLFIFLSENKRILLFTREITGCFISMPFDQSEHRIICETRIFYEAVRDVTSQ